MIQSVLQKTSAETSQKAMNVPLQSQPKPQMAYGARPQTAGGYAQQAARQKSYGRPQTARGARNGKNGGGGIFDRLTDSSQYTGTHKHRFDASGRGRGLDGRDRISKGGFGLGVSRILGKQSIKETQIQTLTSSTMIYPTSL